MRNFILLFAFMFSFVMGYSQTSKTYEYVENDTLTNADTVVFTTMEFTSPFFYAFSIKQDSLSGATAGTITFEYQTNDGSTWHPLYTSIYTDGTAATAYTATINGVSRVIQLRGDLLSGKIRATIITSGTQSTRIRNDVELIRKY